MVGRYIIASSAQTDLDEIWSYIESMATASVADSVVDNVTGVFPLLAANPGMGLRRTSLGVGIRSFPVSNYRIYYHQIEQEVVRILHIKHAAQRERRVSPLN